MQIVASARQIQVLLFGTHWNFSFSEYFWSMIGWFQTCGAHRYRGQLWPLWSLVNPFNYQSMQNWIANFVSWVAALVSFQMDYYWPRCFLFHTCVINGSKICVGTISESPFWFFFPKIYLFSFMSRRKSFSFMTFSFLVYLTIFNRVFTVFSTICTWPQDESFKNWELHFSRGVCSIIIYLFLFTF